MKQVLTLIAVLIGITAFSQGNWTLTGTRNRWGNGMGFSSKSASQLDAFTNASDSNLVQWSREDSTLAIRGSIYAPWRKLSHSTSGDFIRNQIGGNLSAQAAKFYITDTGWAAKLLRSNKGLIDSIQASSSAGGYLVTNGGAAVMHWGGGGSVEVDFKGFAGYDANRSSSYTARSFTDKGYVDSSFLAYTTLQNAYNNSSIPNITTNTTNRAVSIQRGTGADTDSVFVVRNGAGTVTSAITGDGRVLANKVNANDTIRTSGVGQFGDQFTIGFFTLPKLWVDGNAAINGTTLNINGSSPTYSIQTSPGVGATTSRLIVQSGGASAGTLSFPSLSTSRQWDLPNASGTIALTSNVTDSAAALRASINTKLNISDTAAMLTNYLRKTDTATMLSRLTFDRVLANGNTTGRTFTAGGATLTGALSGTSGAFSGQFTMASNASANVGVGTTPSAWASTWKVVQVQNSALASLSSQYTFIGQNWYNDGASKYIGTGRATLYQQFDGEHSFFTSASGTAGGTISFTEALTIKNSGNVGIGTTSPSYKLDVHIGTGTIYSGRFYNSSTATDDYNVNLFLQGASGSAVGYIGTGGSTVGNPSFRNTFVVGTQSNNPLVFNVNDGEAARFSTGRRLLVNTTTDDGSNIIQAAGGITATGKVFAKGTGTTTGLTLASTLIYEESDQSFNITIPGAFPTIGFKMATTTGAATFSSTLGINGVSDNVKGATYTPTITGVANVSSSTASVCQYIRIGNVVTVYGKASISTTTTGNTTFDISLPISSALSLDSDANGVCTIEVAEANMTLAPKINANTLEDRMRVIFELSSSGTYTLSFTFSYEIK